jgi:hypothetical protein
MTNTLHTPVEASCTLELRAGNRGSPPQSRKWTQESEDAKQAAHRSLHPSGGTHLEEEARLTFAGVAHDVYAASRHVHALANRERVILAAYSHHQGTGKDLDAFVLTGVDVAGNPPTAVEANF